MKLKRTTPLPTGPLGLVALVNVVLLLMFFFVLGSSFVLQPGINVTLPFSQFTLPPQIDAQLVTMQPGPPPRIFYHDQSVTVAELGRQLANYRGSRRAIILRADLRTPYDAVMAVMNQALNQEFSVTLATVPNPGNP